MMTQMKENIWQQLYAQTKVCPEHFNYMLISNEGNADLIATQEM